MSSRVDPDALTDEQWARLATPMPAGCKGKRGPRTNNRFFLDALLWMTRSGGRWKDLPERFGKVGTVKRRYYDWMPRSVPTAILAALAEEADWGSGCASMPPSCGLTAKRRERRAKKGARMPRAWVAPVGA